MSTNLPGKHSGASRACNAFKSHVKYFSWAIAMIMCTANLLSQYDTVWCRRSLSTSVGYCQISSDNKFVSYMVLYRNEPDPVKQIKFHVADAKTGQEIAIIDSMMVSVGQYVLVPGTEEFLYFDDTSYVRRNWRTGELVSRFEPDGPVKLSFDQNLNFKLSPDAKLLISRKASVQWAGCDSLIAWSVQTGKIVGKYYLRQDTTLKYMRPTEAYFDSSGSHIILFCDDVRRVDSIDVSLQFGDVIVYNTYDMSIAAIFDSCDYVVAPRGTNLYLKRKKRDEAVRIVSLTNLRDVGSIPLSRDSQTHAIYLGAVSADESVFFDIRDQIGREDHVRVWDVVKGKIIDRVYLSSSPGNNVIAQEVVCTKNAENILLLNADVFCMYKWRNGAPVTVKINERELTTIYPNPGQGIITMPIPSQWHEGNAVCFVGIETGNKIVISGPKVIVSGDNLIVNVGEIPQGSYLVSNDRNAGQSWCKVIVNR